MDANVPISNGDKNKVPAESQSMNQPLPPINPYKVELSYQAVNRLARILAEIAESNSKNSTKPNQDE